MPNLGMTFVPKVTSEEIRSDKFCEFFLLTVSKARFHMCLPIHPTGGTEMSFLSIGFGRYVRAAKSAPHHHHHQTPMVLKC